MADVAPQKSHALKFAEAHMKRHGWEEGKGLGREEKGISEAIKVKVKSNKGGVGHKEGEQFTFHWWDHVFNKASSSLQVESDQNGIVLTKTPEEGDDDGTPISNKKPRKASLAKSKLYGCFVKSATLLSGLEQPEPKSDDSSSSSSSSSDEDEDQQLDLSSTTKISDADLMEACGGRTAHKGARHGLTMSAKLARLEQQEAEFMAKYGKKTHKARETAPTVGSCQSSDQEVEEKMDEDSLVGERKRKKSKVADEDIPEKGVEAKKKKKKSKSQEATQEITNLADQEEEVRQNRGVDGSQGHKKKHKKKKNDSEEEVMSSGFTSQETATDSDRKVRKKKKKSSKELDEEEERDDQASEVVDDETSQKQKRKKCKKDKEGHEELLPKKKKKKSADE